ncbi:MAG: ABC transporter ATP-binding protein [Zoogloeaceae bacterium]|jgi:lipopolysaccharide transport system ATP-binding protein|nr:ABC transporter ATP-binding protein [Zoogloeaceae bacterium]
MDSQNVIQAENLGKAYLVATGGWSRLAALLGRKPATSRWVFRDVNFSIRRGESVGIIGANGAGKSTLLKVLTGTTSATTGRLSIAGNVAALLELGMGFHGDFTGRQNVYFSGQLQNRSRQEIEATMAWIQDFAEIGDYFDQPVRNYSSGMFVRLAFAVATAQRPEILIVDEALAVGDMYFQHKSFARIREFHAAGTSLLFVSHDPVAVKSLCERALLLGDARLLMDGAAGDVLDYYSALVAARENRGRPVDSEQFQGRSGTGEAKIEQVVMLADGQPTDFLQSGASVTLRVRYRIHAAVRSLTLGLLLKDRTGYDIFGTNTTNLGMRLTAAVGESATVEFRLPRLLLGAGSYSLTFALHSFMDHLEDNYDWWERAIVFRVMPNPHQPYQIGVAAFDISAEEIPE